MMMNTNTLNQTAIFILAVVFLTCPSCMRYRINYTASKTGIPVLLSAIDRVGDQENKPVKQLAENVADEDKMKITVQGYETISAGSSGSDRSSIDYATYVDQRILSKSLGKPVMNMYIDSLDVNSTGLYLLFGHMDISKIISMGHLEEITPSTVGESKP